MNLNYWPVFLIFCCSCQPKPSNPDLTNIALLRGDIALCGGGNFGEINWPVRCKTDARPEFNLAVSLLHSFEYEEAEKAFVKVIDLDPECAMAYWGIAMSNFHTLWLQQGTDYLVKGAEIIAASRALSRTEKEKDFIEAIAGFYDDWETRSHRDRVTLFESRMKQVYEKYPEDKEAAIFYSLAMTAAADPTDKTFSRQLESARILNTIYPDQPNHPGIAHYLIHNYDYPELANLALPTAQRYAEIAPASAHAQHMPSHIFTRLGLWDESIQSNLQSVSSALCYAGQLDSTGHWDEELHGMDYLVYAFLQKGENKKAIEQNDYLKTFRKVFPVNFKVAYAVAAIPARIVLENKNWTEAAKLDMPVAEIDWKKFPWQRSILHFARAMGAARTGDMASAERELMILDNNIQELQDLQLAYQANQVSIQATTVRAWMALAKGQKAQAVELMKTAASMEYTTTKHPVTPGEVLPAGELLGDLLMEVHQPGEALKAYEYDLQQHPNRFNGLYGAAAAANALHYPELARHYFEILINKAPNSERPESEVAKNFLNI